MKKKDGATSIDIPQLRPFFGYYGGKWRDALKYYPEPQHATIVEPFAGSAGFSLRYAARKVILCEVDPVLAAVWRYLIRVKVKEILSIPDLAPGESVDDLKVGQEAKWLVGFWLNRGAASPRKSPSKWMREGIRPGSFWGDRVRNTIASQVDAIRHWEIHNRSYTDCPAPRAVTWFVDPPYEAAGRHYRFGSGQIDYPALGAWCKSRPGQVIVCENGGATWLPFRDLAEVKTTRADRRSKEVYWLNTFGAPENGQRPADWYDNTPDEAAMNRRSTAWRGRAGQGEDSFIGRQNMAKKQRSLEEQAATDPGAKLVLADKRQESVRDWYAAMIGEIVVVYANFIYTGELTAIDDATVWIKDPSIIYDSGLPTADKWADESRMSVRRLCIQRSSIESMGVVDRT